MNCWCSHLWYCIEATTQVGKVVCEVRSPRFHLVRKNAGCVKVAIRYSTFTKIKTYKKSGFRYITCFYKACVVPPDRFKPMVESESFLIGLFTKPAGIQNVKRNLVMESSDKISLLCTVPKLICDGSVGMNSSLSVCYCCS